MPYNHLIQTQGGISMALPRRKRKAFVARQDCVACGCCAKVCPLGAVAVYQGIYAQVDAGRCVGCGKCAAACPAEIITLVPREEAQ